MQLEKHLLCVIDNVSHSVVLGINRILETTPDRKLFTKASLIKIKLFEKEIIAENLAKEPIPIMLEEDIEAGY